MKKINGFYIITASLIIICSALVWNAYDFSDKAADSQQDHQKNLTSSEANIKNLNDEKIERTENLTVQKQSTEANVLQDKMTWRIAHGYFSKSELLVYESYSNEVLSKLLNSGDLRAAEVLGRHILASQNNPDARRNFSAVMFKAAAYGSTWALIQSSNSGVSGEHLDDLAYQRKLLLGSLS